jgi:cytochrome c-type biogenesis protein CcmF
VIELTHRNTRRYGGYVVHMGIVLMFIGFTGTAFYQNKIDELKIGESSRLGRYQIKVLKIEEGENANYLWHRALVETQRDGKLIGVLKPEGRIYKAERQPLHNVDIAHRLNEDFYLNFAGVNEDRAVIQSYVFPLVSWIWIGALTLVFGTLVALVPSKVKREYARTEVVGITRKHVSVER